MTREQLLKREIIAAGARCASMRLVVAKAGNISCRLDRGPCRPFHSGRAVDDESILITASGAGLGTLTQADIVKVPLTGGSTNPRKPSSEFPLHRLIYLNFPEDRWVVHCHPSLANAYFSVNRKLKNLTFEAKFYLGDVPVVRQKTLTVTEPGPVIEALKASGIVVVKNHGVFSRGKDAESALERVAILEEACRIHAFACLFRNSKPGPLDTELKQYLRRRA